MRSALLAAAVAVTATVLFLVLLFREPSAPANPGAGAEPPSREKTGIFAPQAPLRAYRSFATLVEDCRDALAGPQEKLQAEWQSVSDALRPGARYALVRVAGDERSPRVRALFVLAAGVWLPDDPALLSYLADPEAVVRRAAALAIGHAPKGVAVELLPGLAVPVGRRPGPAAQKKLREAFSAESQDAVRQTITALFRAAELSPPQ